MQQILYMMINYTKFISDISLQYFVEKHDKYNQLVWAAYILLKDVLHVSLIYVPLVCLPYLMVFYKLHRM